MVAVDHTSRFRAQVQELSRVRPPNKPKGKARQNETAVPKDGFLSEAYAILSNIKSLSKLLVNIRRPYLNVDATGSQFRGDAPRTLDLTGSPEVWANVRHLTNEERDQIDLQTKLILSRCAERVSQLEQFEQRRIKSSDTTSNTLLKLLPARLTTSSSLPTAELVNAHRTNITWYLTRRLADLSQFSKEMQEERVKRQLERARTLGSSTAYTDSSANSSSLASSYTYVPPPVTDATPLDDEDDEDDYANIQLSQSQIQQFEDENASILRAAESMLASVQKAESRIVEISQLQTELVVQLARQTEQVEHLYDEAMVSQGEVERGNVQLRKARDRAKNSRKWILLFILMATFAMLFLHWYD